MCSGPAPILRNPARARLIPPVSFNSRIHRNVEEHVGKGLTAARAWRAPREQATGHRPQGGHRAQAVGHRECCGARGLKPRDYLGARIPRPEGRGFYRRAALRYARRAGRGRTGGWIVLPDGVVLDCWSFPYFQDESSAASGVRGWVAGVRGGARADGETGGSCRPCERGRFHRPQRRREPYLPGFPGANPAGA